MPDDDQRPSHLGGRLLRGLGVLLLAIFLYAFSIGPAVWLSQGRSLTIGDTLDQCYMPLIFICQLSGTQNLLVAYILWWQELPGGPNDRQLRQLRGRK